MVYIADISCDMNRCHHDGNNAEFNAPGQTLKISLTITGRPAAMKFLIMSAKDETVGSSTCRRTPKLVRHRESSSQRQLGRHEPLSFAPGSTLRAGPTG